MTSLSRPSRILGAALLLAGLMIGAALAQGQAPKLAPAVESPGRYRSVVVVVNPGVNRIVITDTITGRSWYRGIENAPKQWTDLGTPVEAK